MFSAAARRDREPCGRSPLSEGHWQRPGIGELRPHKQRPRVSVAAWFSLGPDEVGSDDRKDRHHINHLEAGDFAVGCVWGNRWQILTLLFTCEERWPLFSWTDFFQPVSKPSNFLWWGSRCGWLRQ